MERICVVGAGYVGLVTAACFSELGHYVTCIEVDSGRLDALGAGQLPIHEPGLLELVSEHSRNGRLRFTGDFAKLAGVESVFVAVPTPSRDDGEADLSFVLDAINSVLAQAGPGLLLVIKSTVPVGTADAIASLRPVVDARIEVVSNPEFLRQGTAVDDFLHPDRVVIGAAYPEAAERLARIYEPLDAPIIMVDRRSAELAKYTANALLATRISFMNEISHIASAVHANIDDVALIVGMDRRIGPSFLKTGLGWGGSCFPKDVLALTSAAAGNGCQTPILRAVHEINQLQREHAIQLLSEALRGLSKPVVAILGAAFKPNTDDVRGSPALTIAQTLIDNGVQVRVHDPFALANARRVVSEIDCQLDAYSALDGADAVLLATEWDEYYDLDWILVRETMRGKTVVDGRNALDGAHLTELGFHYRSFGRPEYNGHGNGNGNGNRVHDPMNHSTTMSAEAGID